jgi:hypothetical protein
MTRFRAWTVMSGAMAVLICNGATVSADVTLDISGTFGAFSWGNFPAPLDSGWFSGTVTLPSLPGANTEYSGDTTADVNFYNSANNLVFSVDSSLNWVTLTAGSVGYEELTIAAHAAGNAPVVAPLSLEFSSWAFGDTSGTVQNYGPPAYNSYISYTYLPSTTYYDPVMSGLATVSTANALDPPSAPEPSTLAISLISVLGGLIHARCRRRPSTA